MGQDQAHPGGPVSKASLAPEALGTVSPESLRRAEADEAATGGNGGGNLIAAIQDHAGAEIARLEREVTELVTLVRSKNERIAALKTHAAISPKDA